MIHTFEYRKRIAWFLLRFFPMLSLEEVSDIVQDSHSAWENLEVNRKAVVAYPMGWCCTIARRRALDVIRNKKTTVPIHDGDVEMQVYIFEQYNRKNLHQDLAEAIEQLPPKMKALIYNHYLKGYSYKEIACMKGKSVESVKKMGQRALRELRKILEVSPPQHEEALMQEYGKRY